MDYYRTLKYIYKETDEYFRKRIKDFFSNKYIPTEEDKYIIWSLNFGHALNLCYNETNKYSILYRKFMSVVFNTFSDKLPRDEE